MRPSALLLAAALLLPSLVQARVNRGGSWLNFAQLCRSADRAGGAPDYRLNFLGFRAAAVPSAR